VGDATSVNNINGCFAGVRDQFVANPLELIFKGMGVKRVDLAAQGFDENLFQCKKLQQ
jgi:hypothetical protein